MIYHFLALLTSFTIRIISTFGYPGVFILTLLQSSSIPFPSEVTFPFAGYLVFSGKFSFWLVVIIGVAGNVVGSLLAYFIGYCGGRPLVENLIKKYGKYILISLDELELARKWFEKYGKRGVFISRMVPVVRTFISLPAGIMKMPLREFIYYTFLGSLINSVALTYIGVFAGENWIIFDNYFRKFDWLIFFLGITGLSYWFYKKFKKQKAIYGKSTYHRQLEDESADSSRGAETF